MKAPKVLSLFSGCGGLDLGFEKAGFRTIAMLEKMEWACETLRQNFPQSVVIGPPEHNGDICDMGGEDILEITGSKKQDIEMIVGGPPCQPFSVAAAQRFLKGDIKYKRKGTEDKERGLLIFEFMKIVSDIQPEFFMIENVPGLVGLDNGKTFDNIRLLCEGLGYNVSRPYLANAASYGVPQTRMRVFIIASKNNVDLSFPEPTHLEKNNLLGLPQFRTVAHALYNFPENAANHVPRAHLPESIARYRKLKFGEREKLGRVDRLDPCKPSKTVIAGGMKGGGRSHLHPYLARTLTVRECARLQSFPDDFIFTGTMGRQFTQVGNAVPPLLAEVIALHVRKELFKDPGAGEPSLGNMYPNTTSLKALCEDIFLRASRESPDLLYENDCIINNA